ncbi:hypothetical protein CVT26_005449 [Gymnopilus dilepis]|uniref:Uncharacterized protein n=1 Tax=Gymnopilus dilepis TaxID=231916 RepID=A0A409WH96_9AGAR|nr:hypothetical protein CVT26_005449 [Gymnopilus dilepis]
MEFESESEFEFESLEVQLQKVPEHLQLKRGCIRLSSLRSNFKKSDVFFFSFYVNSRQASALNYLSGFRAMLLLRSGLTHLEGLFEFGIWRSTDIVKMGYDYEAEGEIEGEIELEGYFIQSVKALDLDSRLRAASGERGGIGDGTPQRLRLRLYMSPWKSVKLT